ncbi:MAG: glycoside hydrolase family 3 N-terminal domain-containing protein, partial [Bacillota bacterium]|nr:glycoside hydrolase family 3 N-terminal domain-containing protein [Bacillota bacterium]
MAVNLKSKPFYLSDEDIKWVNDTIADMTIEEKIGQLFIHYNETGNLTHFLNELDQYHTGAARLDVDSAKKTYEDYKVIQQNSKIPYLIPFNGDQGGNGVCSEGTVIASSAACGATSDTETAYNVGFVAGREAAAVGINWDFGPCVDLLFNWRNTIINTRAYGNDVDKVIENSKAYIKGLRESNVAACAKHFPGDGVEELDQHLVTGINSLSSEEWDNSFGKVYKALIDDGLQSIMIGHIALPEYSRKLRPGIKDAEIMPASLAAELLQDLLRDQLGFNGLIVTDASHMAGMTSAMPRKDQVPGAIAAGCDIFLYFNKPHEDYSYMMEGYENGIITEERLHDALSRILGLKAALKLHERSFPGEGGLSVIGCEEHLEMAKIAADKSITLVKDTEQ